MVPARALFVIGLWAFLLAVVLRPRGGTFPGPSAEGVLAERYARGEIDAAEYRERRSVLRRED